MDIKKIYKTLIVILVFLTLMVSGIGLFYMTDGQVIEVENPYGDRVEIFGQGTYARDTLFKAPIFRGTDLIVLTVVCPLLIFLWVQFKRRGNLANQILLVSVVGVIMYYSASIAFGVTFNNLLLLYIALFAMSFFTMILGMMSLDYDQVDTSQLQGLKTKGLYIFLTLCGLALFIAWLPDILTAMVKNQSLALIEIYTTEITYVLDMGIISPLIFLCIYLLRKDVGMGYVLLQILLTSCGLIGLMVASQTIFQFQAGIDLPLPVLLSKAGTFVLLALFALYFTVKNLKFIGKSNS